MDNDSKIPLNKLNLRRTIILGITFFAVLMLTQIYNSQAPLFLEQLLGEGNHKYLIGIIMAGDNLLAIIALPLFGMWSDKTKGKSGRRMPFIFIGTVLLIFIFPLIPVFYMLNNLAGVIISMGLTIIIMNMYRNPSVSLVSDITPKPLRTKASGIVNLVGYTGAILAGILYMIPAGWGFTSDSMKTSLIPPDGGWMVIIPFIVTAVIMLNTLIILLITINENKIAVEMKEEIERGEELSETEEKIESGKKMSKKDKTNFILIISSIFLWFTAFNAIETFWSTFALETLKENGYAMPMNVLVLSSLITFIPAALLSSKIGKKRMIILGLTLLIIAFGCGIILNHISGTGKIILMYFLFMIAGIGWAMITACSYPLIMEYANKKNVGLITGTYYVASMSAQSVTPICIGFLMDSTDNMAFFPYATIVMATALICFMFVRNKHDKFIK